MKTCRQYTERNMRITSLKLPYALQNVGETYIASNTPQGKLSNLDLKMMMKSNQQVLQHTKTENYSNKY